MHTRMRALNIYTHRQHPSPPDDLMAWVPSTALLPLLLIVIHGLSVLMVVLADVVQLHARNVTVHPPLERIRRLKRAL